MDVAAPEQILLGSDFVLDLPPGKILDLQLNTPVSVRLKLSLIGYDVGKYLILKYPHQARPAQYADVLTQDNVAIVRYIVEGEKGECVAFATTIRHISLQPDKLIFLQYPKRIENRQLRNQQRLQTQIPAKIGLRDQHNLPQRDVLSGLIIDINENGCRFMFKTKTQSGQVNQLPIAILIYAATSETPIQVQGFVRNSTHHNGRGFVGIQFESSELAKVRQLMAELSLDLY